MITLEQLQQEAGQIQSFLEITVSEDPNEMVSRLSDLSVYMARTGKMLADAQHIRDKAIANVYAESIRLIEKMPATVTRKFVESQTANENHIVTWLERLNRSCTHQSENLRTQVSFAKQQLEMTRSGY